MNTYITDLGFYADEAPLGPQPRSKLLVLGVYVALAMGIFLRQISAFPAVDLRPQNLRISVAVASIILALVIAPPMNRWISRRHQGLPSWEHVLWTVTYGFFSDLLMNKIVVDVLKVAT
jgi:hypothetical protein